jgi:hypothetical protein
LRPKREEYIWQSFRNGLCLNCRLQYGNWPDSEFHKSTQRFECSNFASLPKQLFTIPG